MKLGAEQFQQFLDAHLPVQGIVAAVIRLRDRTILTHRNGDALTDAQMEQCLAALLPASDGLRRQRVEARSLCWTFEKAHIHFAQHQDGAMLALFSGNIPGEPPLEIARELVEAFQKLQ